MATKKITPKSKKVNNAPRGKRWSELKASTQKRYKAQGVTPAKYNAWRIPSVRAKAKKAGVSRFEYLGLDHAISGSDLKRNKSFAAILKKAYDNIAREFGDYARFRGDRTERWLRTISRRHVIAIAEASPSEVYDRAFNFDETFANEKASKRYGPREDPDIPCSGPYSGGYLFYH